MTPVPSDHHNSPLERIQQSVAGMCIALLLVAGLISVPTSCDCGSGIPHGHSLFILGGHYHGPDGAVFGANHEEHDDHHRHHHHKRETPSVEAQAHLMGRIMHSSDRVAISVPSFEPTTAGWQRVSYTSDEETPYSGNIVTPEAPPPRDVMIW